MGTAGYLALIRRMLEHAKQADEWLPEPAHDIEREVAELLELWGVPMLFLGSTWDTWQTSHIPEQLSQRIDTLRTDPPRLTVLTGAAQGLAPAAGTAYTGSGKSTIAAMVLRGHAESLLRRRHANDLALADPKPGAQYIREPRSGIWVNWPDVVSRLVHDAEAGDWASYRRITKSGMVVLDDIGREMSSPARNDLLWQVIDGIDKWKARCVVTSNYDLDGLARRYGEQLASRLCTGLHIMMNLPDWRRRSKR